MWEVRASAYAKAKRRWAYYAVVALAAAIMRFCSNVACCNTLLNTFFFVLDDEFLTKSEKGVDSTFSGFLLLLENIFAPTIVSLLFF